MYIHGQFQEVQNSISWVELNYFWMISVEFDFANAAVNIVDA